ncbi:MAG: UDP-N-acetylmuramoyl-tripeptide--D-alanyl-D-alanine ligase [Bacteroidetes bacterium]|nr:UDP-N-acetylmuramoyl-tripeptide--D-alanyl-D-alanine ligase [Bacteroidota bacterium]
MNLLFAFLGVVATVFAASRLVRRTRFFLHLYQLEGYKPNEYRAWVMARLRTHVVRTSHLVGAALLLVGSLLAFAGWPRLGALAALAGWPVAFASWKLYRSVPVKKPLAWTDRMKRLRLATAVVLALVVLAFALDAAFGGFGARLLGAGRGEAGRAAAWIVYLKGWFVADLFAPFWVLLAGQVMKPVEGRIQEGFKQQARDKVAARPDLRVVAITGSYGKTSVKFILAELLGQRYNVLATPGSYNTPMGISIVVNNQLRPEHQVLVLEMGMRYPGDIKELCEIVRPDVAVVTSVGVAHLETMGSVEAIAEEKGSLLREMKPGGAAVLNGDDPRVSAMAGVQGQTLRVSLGDTGDVTGRDVRYGPDGMSMTVRDETGAEAVFTTKLLGSHNALNLLLGVAVGRVFGIRLRAMAEAARRIQPVAHRLALREENGLLILDDAFNSNPVGAKSAVDVLGQFRTGRRVIVTPGMVELGERQVEENRTFGRHIAANADLAVIVGEVNGEAIHAGLRDASYPEDQIIRAKNLYDARERIASWLRPGDVVLYENDLPDQYGG